ncbi:coproporphyrinogen III oxidase [Spiroplasma clarkii]|uniref:Heme chaperone HemW n=1 Tax=Spiroplasma clarkii TaxID=2139 RepID=A0A1Y0L1U8_9MOLU|nr:radical SAM family heme chaperone HemW [Spiroplasma clarkii]ARU91966.1 coproporphyrinogen III oxidase [Spiroplasma clarkii]ATX71307.1 coproporphyrinogen III oxidase [Spiroplasma clarkii]
MKSNLETKQIKSLYVHIPYCEHICFYCDFVKVIKPKKAESIDQYLDLLAAELQNYGSRLDELESIYIGGGTPSCLDIKQSTRLCEMLSQYVKKTGFEFTIELNPESITKEKLELYQKYHINRLSIGVQTFSNPLLKKIGRVHDNTQAIEMYLLARSLGFKNISLDLMYNLFDQTSADIAVDLQMIEKLCPDHISWYSLIMKESSVWGKRKLNLPGNDELFDDLVNTGLEKLGYQRYEISNYARANKQSVHNLSYWNNSLFAGVGVGASGFEYLDGQYYLTSNKGNVLNYKKEFEKLSTADYYFQILMMGLRLVDGIDLTQTDNKKMFDFYEAKITEQVKLGFLEISAKRLRCTKRGFNIMNEILITFL